MTEWAKVANVEDIPSGGRIWHETEEDTVIDINVNDTFFRIADFCLHDGGPFEDGELKERASANPWHGTCFDVRTDAALSMPTTSLIPTYANKVEDGCVYVESPDSW